jgi:hypothetical protein
MRWISEIAGAVATVVRAAWGVLQEARNGLARLMGTEKPRMPDAYVPETGVDDVLDELSERLSRVKAISGEAASDVGHAVHQYASALEPLVRCAVDLTPLDAVQMDWLLSLSDADLAKLSKVGPRRCESLARGKQAGVVGFPMPGRQPEASVKPAERVTADYDAIPSFAFGHLQGV